MPTIILSPVNILQIIFGIQAIFSIVILFPKKRNRSLIYLLIALAFLMMFNLLEELQISYYLITPAFSLAFGPLFYIFVRQLTLNELPRKLSYFYHLLPSIFSLLITQYVQLVLAMGTVSQLLYFVLSLKLLKVYKQACYSTQSDAILLQLNWLRNILIAMIFITLVDLLRLNLQTVLELSVANYWYFFMQLQFYVLMNYLVIQAIWQPRRFTGLQYYLDGQQQKVNNKLMAEPIFNDLDKIIVEEKLFRKARFSLQDLTLRTGLSSKDISWAINEGCQLNFCDYINRYRIEEIKTKLALKSNLNLLDIALDAGFNSKSSFNKSFKKQEGITPSQYLKSIKS